MPQPSQNLISCCRFLSPQTTNTLCFSPVLQCAPQPPPVLYMSFAATVPFTHQLKTHRCLYPVLPCAPQPPAALYVLCGHCPFHTSNENPPMPLPSPAMCAAAISCRRSSPKLGSNPMRLKAGPEVAAARLAPKPLVTAAGEAEKVVVVVVVGVW